MHIDPAVITQLIVALTTLAVALAGWLKSQANGKKLDDNTQMTSEIHKVTNGPLTDMEHNVSNLAVQIAANAVEARSTAEAAKAQAATDASASKANV
jgi:hypothetical protein